MILIYEAYSVIVIARVEELVLLAQLVKDLGQKPLACGFNPPSANSLLYLFVIFFVQWDFQTSKIYLGD